MYAILETGGKQYKVRPGDTLQVEKLPGDAGDTVELDRVLMVADDEAVAVGKPLVEVRRCWPRSLARVAAPRLSFSSTRPRSAIVARPVIDSR